MNGAATPGAFGPRSQMSKANTSMSSAQTDVHIFESGNGNRTGSVKTQGKYSLITERRGPSDGQAVYI